MLSAVHMRPRPIGCLMLALRVALVLLPHRRGSGIAASASLAGVIMIFYCVRVGVGKQGRLSKFP